MGVLVIESLDLPQRSHGKTCIIALFSVGTVCAHLVTGYCLEGVYRIDLMGTSCLMAAFFLGAVTMRTQSLERFEMTSDGSAALGRVHFRENCFITALEPKARPAPES